MKYVEYFRQEICDSGELYETVGTLLLLGFIASVIIICIGSLA